MSVRVPEQQNTSAASSIRSSSPDRPMLRGARSFSRLEPSTTNPLSRLANELTIPEASDVVPENPSPIEENEEEDTEKEPSSTTFPEGFDELPIELLSLTDRFIESLSAKIHPTPLAVSQLTDLFQQFYVSAFQQIDTHISHSYLSLSSKKPRSSPSASKNPTQMLSIGEIAQKKRDRKMLEVKRLALEEAVEKRITEGVYDRIWRHKSTDDEARDESLRSKMAALNVVGVKLGHLGVELEGVQGDIEEELRSAVMALVGMNDQKNPLGKLQSLKQAHKAIVDWLSTHNSSSSADFILPTLIYTLIISPPTQDFNIISNLFFIQRFRAKKAIDGEAAYCLTNLEAAISFLETVDLATLKVEDPDEGRSRSRSRSPLPKEESLPETPEIPWSPVGDPLSNLTDKLAAAHAAAAASAIENAGKPPAKTIGANPSASSSTISLQPPAIANPTPMGHGVQRRLSYLTPIDLATGAISTADQGIRGIGNTLESSYKFLFGKMEKRGEELPKTLEDARKLVDSPTVGDFDDEKITESDGGLKRVESEASIKSTQSHKAEKEATFGTPPRSSTTPAAAAAEKLGNLGTSIGRFAVRGFTRSATPAAPTTLTQTDVLTGAAKGLGIIGVDKGQAHKRNDSAPVADLLTTFPDLATSLPQVRMGVPPITRFLEVEDPGELRISEVGELLKDYKRLVEELRVRGALE